MSWDGVKFSVIFFMLPYSVDSLLRVFLNEVNIIEVLMKVYFTKIHQWIVYNTLMLAFVWITISKTFIAYILHYNSILIL